MQGRRAHRGRVRHPPDAWYFDENGAADDAVRVLLEAALQPCGWLASYVGCALTVDETLLFRNLDGTAPCTREVRPDAGILRTTSAAHQRLASRRR